MVPAGSTLTYQAKAKTTFTQTPSDIESAVAGDLVNSGLIVTDNSIINPSLLSQLGGAGYYSFQLSLTIQTQEDYDKASDIQSIIDHFIYQETGSMPESSSIQGSGSTEQPQAAGPGITSTGDWLTKFIGQLETLGQGAILGIGLLAIGILVIIIFVPKPRNA